MPLDNNKSRALIQVCTGFRRDMSLAIVERTKYDNAIAVRNNCVVITVKIELFLRLQRDRVLEQTDMYILTAIINNAYIMPVSVEAKDNCNLTAALKYFASNN